MSLSPERNNWSGVRSSIIITSIIIIIVNIFVTLLPSCESQEIPIKSRRYFGSEDLNSLHDDLYEKAIFNVTVNFIVPMVSCEFPRYSASGNPLDLTYQVVLAGFGIVAVIGYIGVPTIMEIVLKIHEALNEDDGRTSRKIHLNKRDTTTSTINSQSRNDHVINHNYFMNKIGLDWEECLKKTICEAHTTGSTKQYGLLALPFQIFYPKPFMDPSFNKSSTGTTWPTEQHRNAAENGFIGKNSCGYTYNCFFDVLDLGVECLNLFEGFTVQNKIGL